MLTERTILVVDDDADVRDTLQFVLELEGFHVVTEANGRAALERLSTFRPALILLDLRMPICDGWQTLECLRQRPEWADLPVLVCTSTPAVAPSGSCVLRKPVELNDLITEISRLIEIAR